MNLAKMNKLINKLADKPFKHGTNDCFTFTNALVKEWHGKDFRKMHKYKNKSQALLYMAENGGIERLTTGTLGYSVDAGRCNNGDVVLADVGSGDALGFVFDGHGLFKSNKSVVRVPLEKCKCGWRIG